MTSSFARIGIATALITSLGLAQAQITPAPTNSSRTGTVSPSGTLTSPGSIVTPGSPTIPAPQVPTAVSPFPGASSPTSPDAGSLSGTVDQRNTPTGDRRGSPTGNGTVISPSTPGGLSGSGSSSGSSGGTR